MQKISLEIKSSFGSNGYTPLFHSGDGLTFMQICQNLMNCMFQMSVPYWLHQWSNLGLVKRRYVEYDQNCMQVIVTGEKLSGGSSWVNSRQCCHQERFSRKVKRMSFYQDHSIKYMDCFSGGLELETDQWDIWQKLDSELPDAFRLGTW